MVHVLNLNNYLIECTASHFDITINLHCGVQSRSIENVVSGISWVDSMSSPC